jgi:putative ABC transport system permease protein
MIDALTRNVFHACRALARTPGFTLTVVLTLALCIGANSLVFSMINAVLLKPLPFPEAGQLVKLRQTRGGDGENIAPVRLEEWSRGNSTFQAMAGYYAEDVADTGGDLPERLRLAHVTPGFLDVWQIAPALGRGFAAADHKTGASPVALLSYRYWQRRFGGDPRVIGSELQLSGQKYAVVGVMPEGFVYPDSSIDVWAALVYYPYVLNRGSAWLQGFGRLKPDATIEQAQADVNVVQARLLSQFPVDDRDIAAAVSSLKETIVGSARNSLWLVYGAVTVLLLIACSNIAALLMSRAAAREHEIAIRFSLGASRASVAAQTLTEATLLAFLGGGAGIVMAVGATAVLRALVPDLPRLHEVSINSQVLLYTGVSAAAVTLLCGAIPALRSTQGNMLSGTSRTQVSQRHGLQWSLVGVQITLSVILLAGAGLLLRSFERLMHVDAGFDPHNVLTFRVNGSFGETGSPLEVIESMRNAVSTVPGVKSAALSSPVPGVLNDGSGFQFGTARFPLPGGNDTSVAVKVRAVSAGYFNLLHVPIAKGEDCRRPVTPANQNAVQDFLVNQSLAARIGRPAVGLTQQFGTGTARIIGVVGDARDFGLGREPVPTIYQCRSFVAYPPLTFLVRTSGNPLALVGSIRQRLKEVQPTRSIYDVRTLDDRISSEYSQDRLRTALLLSFGGAALALVCLGIYGTLSYIVSLRRREIGLRVALGAQRDAIVRLFMTKALRIVGVACAIGLALFLAVSGLLSKMLFGVSPTDPLTLLGVILAIAVVAALAALLPARRASRAEPMQALREE